MMVIIDDDNGDDDADGRRLRTILIFFIYDAKVPIHPIGDAEGA